MIVQISRGQNPFAIPTRPIGNIVNIKNKRENPLGAFRVAQYTMLQHTVHLLLSESIQTTSRLQQELVDLFLPSFFFLLGVDLLIFLPFDKIFRDIENHLNKKKTVVISVLATVLFLRNPLVIFSILLYISVGFLCARFLFPKCIQREISFYGHLIRDILFVFAVFLFF